ncbi:MAG TPA: hypothetical protein PKC28_13200 [Bdellovibrionales bacterium]|nr:hypothetical protein [Bdellovibrionales bacterium]
MENKVQNIERKAAKKPTKSAASYASIRIPQELKKNAKKWRDYANRNKTGRKIKLHEVLALGLERIEEKDIQELQDKSLTHKERLEILRQKYIKTHGHISEDDFIGFTMKPEFQEFLAQNENLAPAA